MKCTATAPYLPPKAYGLVTFSYPVERSALNSSHLEMAKAKARRKEGDVD